MKAFYNAVCLVVPVVNHFGEKSQSWWALHSSLICGMGAFILRPQCREQSQVLIKEYKGNLRRGESPTSLISVFSKGANSLNGTAFSFFCPFRPCILAAAYPVLLCLLHSSSWAFSFSIMCSLFSFFLVALLQISGGRCYNFFPKYFSQRDD